MKQLFFVSFICILVSVHSKAQQVNERYIDYFFYTGDTDVIAFQINENLECKQFVISGKDTAGYCFKISANGFDSLIYAIDIIRQKIEKQTTPSVNCKVCSTMQLFWNDGSKERSTLKRAYNIPVDINAIIDFCYDRAGSKVVCDIGMKNFKCFQGYEESFRRLEKNKK